MSAVPRLFPGSTIVCIGGGPSLAVGDVNQCRGTARVIAVNDAYRLAPWADVLYACDPKWWKWHPAAASFAGLKYGLARASEAFPAGVETLKNTGADGIERSPSGLRHGRNSGYQAINLAVHLGAARILLLGYDMKADPTGKTHWFGEHPDRAVSPYHMFVQAFNGLQEELTALGIEIVNCSRWTALTQFQRLPIERVLVSNTVAA